MPTKQSKTISKTSRDKGCSKADIYELIKSVPTTINGYLPYRKNEDNILFAEYCLSFLESEYPEKIKDLKFDPVKDGLATFIEKVAKIALETCNITSNEQDVLNDENINNPEDYSLHFIRFFSIAPHYYVLDIWELLKLNEPLRIGYAKILEDMVQHSCYETNIDKLFFKPESWVAEMSFEDLCGELEISAKQLNRLYEKWNLKQKEYQKHLKMDFKIFEDYKPRTEKLKKIKDAITKIHKIGFGHFRNFPDHDDVADYGMSSYHELIIPLIDRNDKFGKWLLESKESEFNNQGVSSPSTVIACGKDGVKRIHSEKDIENFRDLCHAVCEMGFLINGEIQQELL